jgi:phosphate transport system permease protein
MTNRTSILPGPAFAPTGTVLHTNLDAAPAIPRAVIGQLPADDRFLTWGARLAALALAWVIAERLLPLHGLAWFLVVAATCNVVVVAVGKLVTTNTVAVADRVAQWLISLGATIVFAALISVLGFVFKRGWPALHHVNFFTHTMNGVGPNTSLARGGIIHAVVGSLIEVTIAVAITLPLGVGTAVFMNEVGGKFARAVRTVVEAMTALPSIVAGLFIYTVWIIALHQPRSGLAAGLAISVMMLPIIARASDVVLRVVPGTLREASLALGASRWSTVWHVILPTARPGLATALILGVARGIGETSPVLITSGNANFLVTNPTHGVMNSMPLFVFSTVRSGVPLEIDRAFGAAAALLILVLVLFITARLLARPASARPTLWRRRRGPFSSVRGWNFVSADPLVAVGPVGRSPAPDKDNQ